MLLFWFSGHVLIIITATGVYVSRRRAYFPSSPIFCTPISLCAIRLVRPTVNTLHLYCHPLCHNNLTVNGYVGRRAGRHFSGQSVHHLTRIRRELIARFEIMNQQFASVHCVVFAVWNEKKKTIALKKNM